MLQYFFARLGQVGLLVGAWLLSYAALAQAPPAAPCTLSVAGRVADQRTNEPLPGATVQIVESQEVSTTDADGHYHFHGLCPGAYHLRCLSLGYAETTVTLTLTGSAVRDFRLRDVTRQLGGVRVEGQRDLAPLVSQAETILSGRALEQTRGESLGESLKSITGVYSIQSGPTISKPVIHGLYSNRVLILNNGVRQEGQQWGSEHAPEIDPFTATKLAVVKGAASIRYGADAIGGVVLVEPAPLPDTAGVGGALNLVGMTNGRLGAASAFVQGAIDTSSALRGLSWRLQGTLRRAGNARTARYYLQNTGLREQNFSGALGYHRGRYGAELFFSRFDTRNGIFAGSEVGSIADVRAAIARDQPLTRDEFTYDIARPYQAVVHDLLKARAYADLRGGGRVEAIFARQTDLRKEYGALPFNPANADAPDLDLNLISHTLDLIWTAPKRGAWSGSAGFNGATQGNVRNYAFIIPNFRNYAGGAFAIARYRRPRTTLEAGLRYDYRWLRAYQLNTNTLLTETPTTQYGAATGTVGAVYELKPRLTLSANVGTAWRPPTVNELYSKGIHISAASYELGTATLTKEQAYNSNLTLNYAGERLRLELGGYYNYLRNYIYLQPNDGFVVVRGIAFPAFKYTQANVDFLGLDARVDYTLVRGLTLTSKLSALRAYNHSAHDYLIYVPANRLDTSLRYELTGGGGGPLRHSFLGISNLSVARQRRAPAFPSDYAPPPPGYSLWGAEAGTTLRLGGTPLDVSLSATNLFNVEYRDYLNRFRYYAADLGRNVLLRVRIPFALR